MQHREFNNPEVKRTFDSYQLKIRDKLLVLREAIFQVAEEHIEVGEVEETLKWGNPSYLTHRPKSGTTIRLSNMREHDDQYAMSVHCQTSLVSEFRIMYPELNFGGNRSLIFDINSELPMKAGQDFIFCALTYHHRKKVGARI